MRASWRLVNEALGNASSHFDLESLFWMRDTVLWEGLGSSFGSGVCSLEQSESNTSRGCPRILLAHLLC